MASAVYIETQALTRSPSPPAPTTMGTNTNDAPPAIPGTPVAGDGLRVTSLLAITVTCIANIGQTLLGGGSLQCWIYNDVIGLWSRLANSDLFLSWGGATAQRAMTWGTIRDVSRLGNRINFLTNAVTVSGGSDVQVVIQGFAGSFGS